MTFSFARAAVGALSVALVSGAVAASPAAAAGAPDGTGANACHKLTDAVDGTDVITMTFKINVGNPGSVVLAGDCDGGDIALVDDGLTLTTSHPSGFGGSASFDMYDFCGGSNTGSPAQDVTGLFKSGTHKVTLTVDNDCGGLTHAPALYLIVKQ